MVEVPNVLLASLVVFIPAAILTVFGLAMWAYVNKKDMESASGNDESD